MNLSPIYSQKLQLPYSAIGAKGQVRIDRLLNMFQDVASLQCDQFKISGFDMAKKQLKWVVSRYQTKIHRNPHWMEPLEIQTWRAPWKNLYELRQFSIINQNKEELISALGIWILVKASNSKPVRLTPHLPNALLKSADCCPELIKNDHDLKDFDHESEFKIRVLDLDLNQHVNNTVYAQWAIEALPPEVLLKFSPTDCTVSFLKESFFPGTILSCVKIEHHPDMLTTRHSIFLRPTMIKLANLTMKWKKS